MPILPDELAEAINKLETRDEPLADHDIAAVIGEVVDKLKEDGHEIGVELKAEEMAFEFCKNYQNEQTGWGTYYGPMMVTPSGDKYTEWPSIQNITSEFLDYWQTRSQEASHPMLQCRYADLVWDFTPRVRNTTANIVYAHTMIDTTVNVADRRLADHSTEALVMLERALNVCLSINDEARIKRVTESMINYEVATAQIEHQGTWGFSYDLLVENKKITLTEKQVGAIIGALEDKLAEAVEIPDGQQTPRDPFAAQHAAIRLARHYRLDRTDDVKRVLVAYAEAFKVMAQHASAMLGTTWLRKVYDILVDFGLRNEADEVSVLMRNIGKGTKDEMDQLSHKMEFKHEEIEGYLSKIMEGGEDAAAVRIARTFVPNPEAIESQLNEVASGAVLWGMTSHAIIDSEGREIARVGSVQDDPEGRVVLMTSQNMQLESLFLRLALERWFNKFEVTAESLADRVLQSPLFLESRRHLLSTAFKTYLAGEHDMTVHILVPQVEHAFRQLLVLSNRSTYKKGRHGGLNVKVLDDLLRDPVVEDVFGADAVKYFKVLLTDQRGWNLRNNICHGLIDVPSDSPELTDRLIHVVLILSMIQPKQKNGDVEIDIENGGGKGVRGKRCQGKGVRNLKSASQALIPGR